MATTVNPPGHRRPRDQWVIGLLAALVPFIAVLPILLNTLPATNDFVNHLVRCYIIMLHGADPLLDRFYGIQWKAVPNLAMDLIVPPLAGIVGIFPAAKLFMLLDMLLLLSGPHAIYYALNRRFSIGPLAAALFLYNTTDRYGIVNYEISVGLAMWAVALWIALRDAPALTRGLASAACVVVLFFAHLEGAAIYGLAIFSVESPRLWARRAVPRTLAADLAALLLPFLLVLPLLWAGPRGGVPEPIYWGGSSARIRGIREVFESYSWQPDLVVFAAIVIGVGWLVWRRHLGVPPRVWIFALVGGALFAVMPNAAMGAWGAAVRLPVGLLFVTFGMLRWTFGAPRSRTAFLAGLLLLLALRSAEVEAAYRHHNEIRRDIEASFNLIVPGSRVLVARGPHRVDTPMVYLTSLATIERSSLNALEFSHPLQQVLVVKPPYRATTGGYDDDPIPLADLLDIPTQAPPGGFPFDPSGRIYWADWWQHYDYLYVLEPGGTANPAPDRLQPLYQGAGFALYRIRGSAAP